MRSLLFVLISFLIPFMVCNASEPVEVSSRITDVTVFLRGAQVTRQAKISLINGVNTLTFRDLPLNIDPQSIQAKGTGNFVILSLSHQVNYLAGQRKSLQVKQLQDSLRLSEEQLALVNGMKAVMKSEEEMLNANRAIGSSEKGVVLAELKQAADFYRARLTDIKKEEIRLNGEAIRLHERIERLRNQLNLLNAGLNRPTSEILVNISCNESTAGSLIISYTVYEAGWVPVYDIRVKDLLNPVQLFYNARVSQITGEDWIKANITLSTANPQQQGEKPNLQPWYIDFEQPVVMVQGYNMVRSEVMKKSADAPAAIAEAEEMMDESDLALTASSFTEVNENQTNMEFAIKIPYDIPSDNKQYNINIQDHALAATYSYYCAPKLDREAFLVAQITGWESLNLLSGEMNLFFEGTYVGKSFLNIRNTKDTLDLSLGRDKSIIVTRVKRKDFTEEKIIGSNKRETRAWEITVRNTKKQAVNLRIEDQFPVSMNKDIEVEPLDYSGGSYQKESGLITWKQQIEPSSEKKIRLSYAIRYPKDQRVFVD